MALEVLRIGQRSRAVARRVVALIVDFRTMGLSQREHAIDCAALGRQHAEQVGAVAGAFGGYLELSAEGLIWTQEVAGIASLEADHAAHRAGSVQR